MKETEVFVCAVEESIGIKREADLECDSSASESLVVELLNWLRDYAKSIGLDKDNNSITQKNFINEAGMRGLFGMRIPTAYGGFNFSVTHTLTIIQQLAAIDISLAATIVVQHACCFSILEYASLKCREIYLPAIASGKMMASLAISEWEAGSNPRAMITNITPTAKGTWHLNGTKCWIGGASTVGIFIVFAKHSGGINKGISCFIVPVNTPGIEIGEPEEMLGVQATDVRRINFHNVEIGEDNLLGEYGKGMLIADKVLMLGRLFASAMSVGIMKRCGQMMSHYASQRQIGTGLLLENPVTVYRFSLLDAAIISTNSLNKLLAMELDAGKEVPQGGLLASKIAGSEFAWETADNLVQLLGARGLDERQGASKILRDTRFLRIGEGPTETLLMELGALLSANDATIFEFISNRLSAKQAVDSLIAAIHEIHALIQTGEELTNQHQWAYFFLGKLGVWSFLEAALHCEYRITKKSIFKEALNWTRQQFNQTLVTAKNDLIHPPALTALKKIMERIASYEVDIGNLWDSFLPQDNIKAPTSPISVRVNLYPDFQIHDQHQSVYEIALENELANGLTNLSEETGCELERVLLAGFSLLLAKITEHPEINLLVYDVRHKKTVVISGSLRPELSFKELLKQFKNDLTIGYKTWSTPAEAIINLQENDNYFEPDEQTSLTRGVTVCFCYWGEPDKEALKGIDLSLIATQDDVKLSLLWKYHKLFSDKTMERRAKNLLTLFRSALTSDGSIDQLIIVPEEEREFIFQMYGQLKIKNISQTTIIGLFDKIVRDAPNSTALHTPDGIITYAELDEKTNQLAHFLNESGLQPDDVVAFFMGRTPCFIASLLAVLKLGATLLTLNIRHPQERNQLVLKTGKAKFILTERALATLLPNTELNAICIDEVYNTSCKKSCSQLTSKATPTSLAYIIFTSGSTGKPKGVMVSHHAICDQLIARRDLFNIDCDSRILYAAVPNFDIAIWEYFGAFAAGGSIVLSNDNTFTWDPKEAIELIERYQVTHMQISPTQLNLLLLSKPSRQSVISLKYIFSGGELLPKQVQQTFSSILQASLIHVYGSTEAVLDVTCWRCKPTNTYPVTHIGQVFPHKRVYALDKYLQPVPIGVSGDLYIGGELATGYLDEPGLTKSCFITDPFVINSSSRMYRTGDRVRFLENGNIEFLGRADHQIKINGFRVEPGEIETILEKHVGIKQLRVVARKNVKTKNNNSILVAYYVPSFQETLSEKDLKQFAISKLPKEMVPSLFIKLDSLPLTSTDKLDTQALSKLHHQGSLTSSEWVTNDPITKIVVNIWEELLERSVANETDDFFDIGGHSLIAVQLMIRIQEIFAIEISVKEFFDNPTIRGLLEHIKNKQKGRNNYLEPIARQQDELLALADTEKNLWYLQQLNPESGAYNCPEAIRFQGMLDLEILEWAVNNIIERHESLRTIFKIHEGKPTRTILPERKLHLTVIDFSTLADEEREKSLIDTINVEAARPFKFDDGLPLFNAMVFKLSDTDTAFFWNFHHIIADGGSAHIFTRELGELYSAHIENREPIIREVTIQPLDYMYWQNQHLNEKKLEKQINFWKRKLGDAPTEIDIYLGDLQPETSSIRGSRIYLEFPDQLVLSLRHFTKTENCTLFEILMTAYSILIQIISGEDDFTIGTVVSGRKHSSIEHVIGNFANTIVLRNQISPNESMRTQLRKLRNQMLEILDNDDISFEEVVSAIQPNRKKDKNPLFNVFLSLYNGSFYDLKMSGLVAKTIRLNPGVAKFDLNLALFESKDSLEGYLEFKTDLISHHTAKRLSGYYSKILQTLIKNPELCLEEIELVEDEERNLLINVWNDFRAPYPQDKCLHHLFEEQVIRVPDNVAIVFDNITLTYAELNQKANQIARYLRQLGIKPGELVGICVKPSIEMITGLIGIVKAGGAYVPLDPEIPAQRILFITQSIKATVILTQQTLLECIKDCHANKVCLDTDWHLIEKQKMTNLDIPITSDSLIYMIFTSGSTGQPKGVKTLHYNVAALLCNTNYMSGHESDVFAKVNNFAFDISTWEIWTPFILGASLIGIPESVKLMPQAFVEFMRKRNINMMYLPTALFHSISTEIPSAFSTLKLLIVGGEALDPNKARRVLLNNPPKEFVNAYGPTEVTCNAAWYDVTQLPCHAIRVPIGRPISNTQFYICNSKQKLLPIGVKGELYIGGAGVSQGYLNEELTRDYFLSNNFSADKQYMRLYKTGDIVRYLEDGNIEFLGRSDNQVKIRGFRIEIGEIETAIRKIDYVRSAIVLVKETNPTDKRLVAYVELHDNNLSSPVYMLRSKLKELLPGYMIPSVIMIMDVLPLNSNGKINRTKLKEMDISSEINNEQKIFPRNEMELRLAQIWENVIGFDQSSINVNFFDAGGDSLKAIQLISIIKREFSRELSLELLYEKGTIESLAAWLRAQNTLPTGSILIPLYKQKDDRLPLFLVHPLSGSAMCYTQLARMLKYPLFGFQSASLEIDDTPLYCVEEMASIYVKELIKVQSKGPFLVGGWSFGGIVAFEMARQLESMGHTVKELLLFDSAAPGQMQRTLNLPAVLKLCLEEITEQFGAEIMLKENDFSNMNSDELLQVVLQQVKGCGAYAMDAEVNALERLVAVCLANARAVENYHPESGVNCSIVLFRAKNHSRLQNMLVNSNLVHDNVLGWTPMTKKNITVIESKGTHMSFLFLPDLESLTPKILGHFEFINDPINVV